MPESINLVLSNTYGHPNVGDEAILTAMISDIQTRLSPVEITILSLRSELTEKKHPGCRALRSGLLRGWFSTLRAIKNADVLIVGGGGIIQDSTSVGNLLFHLSRPLMAGLMGVPVYYFALGVGPLNRLLSRKLTSWILKKGEYLTVRDEMSSDLLISLGINPSLIEVTADPAVTLEFAQFIEETAEFQKIKHHRKQKLLIGLSLRPIPDQSSWVALQPGKGKKTTWFQEEMVQAAERLLEHFDGQIVFFSMHPEQDDALGKLLKEKLSHPERILIITGDKSPNQMLSLINQVDLMIGMRLHALIFASRSGIPIIGLGYDPKVTGFMRMINQEQWILYPTGWRAQQILTMTKRVWANKQEIVGEINGCMALLQGKAAANLERLEQVLASNSP